MGYTDGESTIDNIFYNIDYPFDAIEVNATNFYQGSRLTAKQWHNLSDEAKKAWDMLSQEAKATILQPRPPQQPYGPGRKPPFHSKPAFNSSTALPPMQHNVNQHDIDTLVS